MKNTNIKDVVLAVTYRCNARCSMCSIWQITDHSREISLKAIGNLPAGIRDINISGGEPFLRQDIVAVTKTIADRQPQANIIISTNGFASELIGAKMKEILAFKPDIGVAISLDGMRKVHEEIRGIPGGFDRVLTTIAILKNLGVKKIKFGFTISDRNYGELPAVYELARRLGFEFSLTLVHSSDNYFNKNNAINQKQAIAEKLDWLIDQELSTWHYKNWARAFYTYGMKYFLLNDRRYLPDYSGQENIFINPQGEVFASDVSEQKIGKLDDAGLKMENSPAKPNQPSWMMCTARPAIKKHWFRAGMWMLINKIRYVIAH